MEINNTTTRDRHCRPRKIRPGDQEVNSLEWEFITMTEQEEDLILRMFRLVGERWNLIAGRVPGRTAEEIERFWIMRHHEMFADRRKKHPSKIENSKADDRW